MNIYDEIRIVEDGELFILLDTDNKVFTIVGLEKANELADFEMANQWIENAEDMYINDLSNYAKTLIEMFGYDQLEEE